METLELSFADGSPGRLACEVAGDVTCQRLADGTIVPPEEAGTLYVLLAPGSAQPWQIVAAQQHGYTLEVQYGTELTLPELPDPPVTRRRASS